MRAFLLSCSLRHQTREQDDVFFCSLKIPLESKRAVLTKFSKWTLAYYSSLKRVFGVTFALLLSEDTPKTRLAEKLAQEQRR